MEERVKTADYVKVGKVVILVGNFDSLSPLEVEEFARTVGRYIFALGQVGVSYCCPWAVVKPSDWASQSERFWSDVEQLLDTYDRFSIVGGVMLIPGWNKSSRAKTIVEKARQLGLTIFSPRSSVDTAVFKEVESLLGNL